jgi:hypothetical protein
LLLLARVVVRRRGGCQQLWLQGSWQEDPGLGGGRSALCYTLACCSLLLLQHRGHAQGTSLAVPLHVLLLRRGQVAL